MRTSMQRRRRRRRRRRRKLRQPQSQRGRRSRRRKQKRSGIPWKKNVCGRTSSTPRLLLLLKKKRIYFVCVFPSISFRHCVEWRKERRNETKTRANNKIGGRRLAFFLFIAFHLGACRALRVDWRRWNGCSAVRSLRPTRFIQSSLSGALLLGFFVFSLAWLGFNGPLPTAKAASAECCRVFRAHYRVFTGFRRVLIGRYRNLPTSVSLLLFCQLFMGY